MDRKVRLPLPLLLALGLLVACGGGATEPVDPGAHGAAAYRVEPPDSPKDVAIALSPTGEVTVRKGLSEEDRAAGRRFPSRESSGWSARHARVVAHGGQPWLTLQRALDGVDGRGSTQVDLEIRLEGAPTRTLSFKAAGVSQRVSSDRQRLILEFVLESGVLLVKPTCSDGAWLRRHGCLAMEALALRWDRGRALVPILELVREMRAPDPAALDVRIEVPGLRWPSAPAPPDEPEPTLPTVTQVADLLDALHAEGLAFVDLGLHSYAHAVPRRGLVEEGLWWLKAHQSPDGSWDADAFMTWCHREPMAADDPGDGHAFFDVGATGAALLAFLGAGYSNRGRHPFAKTVARGFKFLRSRQGADGAFERAGAFDRALSHALATAAMAQVADMTRSPLFLASAGSALAVLPAIWREEGRGADATAATLLAVAAARLAVQDAERRQVPRPWSLDAAFVGELHTACRALAERSTHLDVATGIAGCLLLGDDPSDAQWNDAVAKAAADYPVEDCDPRVLYLYLIAARRLGAPAWKAWTTTWKPRLETRLRADPLGHKCCLGGSWSMPEGVSLPGGRVEATAVWMLANEVYYRYDKVIR